jgi:hypothetical protein
MVSMVRIAPSASPTWPPTQLPTATPSALGQAAVTIAGLETSTFIAVIVCMGVLAVALCVFGTNRLLGYMKMTDGSISDEYDNDKYDENDNDCGGSVDGKPKTHNNHRRFRSSYADIEGLKIL